MKDVKSSNEIDRSSNKTTWSIIIIIMMVVFGPFLVRNLAVGAEIIVSRQTEEPEKPVREYVESLLPFMVDPGESRCVQIVSEYADGVKSYRPCAGRWTQYEQVYSPYFEPKYDLREMATSE